VSSPVRVRVCPDGPVLVRGAETVLDDHGNEHPVTRPVVALCTCGRSSLKPWCDGTHQVVRERGTDRDDDD
jgi:CDGSH-type Zn-finger protein